MHISIMLLNFPSLPADNLFFASLSVPVPVICTLFSQNTWNTQQIALYEILILQITVGSEIIIPTDQEKGQMFTLLTFC